MKVSPVLKGMIDSNGHQPVQIRIYHEGKRTFHPTHIKVPPTQFEKGRVKKTHPKHKEHNQTIERLIIQYQAQAIEGFKKKISKTDFYKYVEATIPTLTREKGTVRIYYSQMNKLKEIYPTLFINDIDKNFLNEYRAYLKEIGNVGNTIWSSFKFIRTFVRKAKAEKLIQDNPFEGYEFPKYVNPMRNYLTEEEVKEVDKFCLDKKCPENIKNIATWFLIGCYTGLRISDIKAFSKKNIVADRLVLKNQKTKEIVGMPLTPRVKKYLERVNYMPPAVHDNTYNETLKTIMALCGVKKNVSSHTARHTAATMLANAGVSQEVTARILGHKDMRSTSVYYKIINKRIDLEMKKLK